MEQRSGSPDTAKTRSLKPEREAQRARDKAYYRRPEVQQRRQEAQRKYYADNSESIKEKSRKWRSQNPKTDAQRTRDRESSRRYRLGNPEKVKERKRRLRLWKYGLSHQDMEALLSEQSGLCAICGTKLESRRGRDGCHVDHDHATGKVRGLLCSGCNLMLGHARDSVDVLDRAAVYLRKHAPKLR